MTTVAVILGTGRKNRYSYFVAKTLEKILREKGVDVVPIDVRDYPQEYTNQLEGTDKQKDYESKIGISDALIIISPEYNHGYPGELKMLLDLAPRKLYEGKYVGLVGVSIGSLGGARCIQQLKLVIIGLRATPFQYSLYVSNVDKLSRRGIYISDEKFLDDANKFIEKFLSQIT